MLVVIGVVAGIVLSGRMRTGEEVVAEPRTPIAAAAPAVAATQAASPGLSSAGPDFTRVASQTVRAVTNISSVQVARQPQSPFGNDPFFQYFFGDDDMFGARDRYARSLGSGVIVSADGLVVTNNHVLGEGRNAEVTVSLADKREVRAKVLGVDSWTDLALLKIDGAALPVIPWGDSSRLKVAEWVMAIGNPFQLSETVTLGIVSALGRANVGISTYEDFIQTDAAINPGNSGGALVNGRGELIGINTAIFSQSGGYQGIGFAVPSNLVRRVIDDLAKFGQVRRGSIGYLEVAPLTTHVAEQLGAPNTNGVVITGVLPGSPAALASITAGDIIVAVNGQDVSNTAQLVRTIADLPIGSTAAIDIVRDGRRQTFKVPVERQQERRPRRR
ncbi:MAG: trypsin-like peptidase domain-containing protein [Vicinamibacterales bacterium]